MVLPDQFIDQTRHRDGSFFGDGAAAHVALAEPVCPTLVQALSDLFSNAQLRGIRLHRGGTYVCIDGPSFSTRAESLWFRSIDASVIGLTNMPEARLAREAEMAYATLATDWDCWHSHQLCVTAAMAVTNLRCNAERAQLLLQHAVQRIAAEWPSSPAHTALSTVLVTPPSGHVRRSAQALRGAVVPVCVSARMRFDRQGLNSGKH